MGRGGGTESLMGRGAEDCGRILCVLSGVGRGCLCGARRAEAHMDGALKTLHKEVENERSVQVRCDQLQPVHIKHRGLS